MIDSANQEKSDLAGVVKEARSAKGLSASQMASAMGVTEKYFAAVEKGNKHPSEMFVRFLCVLLGLEIEPMLKLAGIQKPTLDYSRIYKMAGSLIVGFSLATPVFPVAASSLLAGAGVATLITRLTQAFHATNDKELAEKYLGIAASTLSNWRSRGKIPAKYIRLAAEKTGKSVDWFYSAEENTDLSILTQLLLLFETKQQELKKTIQPQKKSELISVLYMRSIKRGEIDPAEVEMVVLACA